MRERDKSLVIDASRYRYVIYEFPRVNNDTRLTPTEFRCASHLRNNFCVGPATVARKEVFFHIIHAFIPPQLVVSSIVCVCVCVCVFCCRPVVASIEGEKERARERQREVGFEIGNNDDPCSHEGDCSPSCPARSVSENKKRTSEKDSSTSR
jgi:hypothetical protein